MNTNSSILGMVCWLTDQHKIAISELEFEKRDRRDPDSLIVDKFNRANAVPHKWNGLCEMKASGKFFKRSSQLIYVFQKL